MNWWMVVVGVFCGSLGFMANAILSKGSEADNILLGDRQYEQDN